MNLELTDKITVVTGGSKGIGLAVARAFVAEGAKVALIARNPQTLDEARNALAADGLHVEVFAADLSDPESAEAVIDAIENQLGPIDILINSAGAAKRYEPETLDNERWHAAFDAKFFPYINTQDAVLKRLRARAQNAGGTLNGAAIVNIVGGGGKHPTSTHIAGGSANAALMLSTVGLASHYARYGIRINVINPGSTYTGRVDQALELDAKRRGISKEQVQREGEAQIPMGRYAKPEEVADVALFLASARASFVTGVVLPVNGGANPVV